MAHSSRTEWVFVERLTEHKEAKIEVRHKRQSNQALLPKRLRESPNVEVYLKNTF